MAKNKIKPKGRPARTTLQYPERFMVRCTKAQRLAWEERAESLGLRRGPHDSGVGVRARELLDADAEGRVVILERGQAKP